jgi:hypothetical protein
MDGGGRCSVRWELWTREWAKEGGGECGDGRGCSSPFFMGREESRGEAVPVKKRSPLMAAMMPAFRAR